jgi:Tfp pilus assembly PilM family ATPase
MGGGLRTAIIKRLNVEFIVAQPFNVYATNNDKNNTRFMFNVYYVGGTIFG